MSNEDVFALAAGDADAPLEVSDNALEAIAQLAARQLELEDWILRQEERLAIAKKNLQRITEHDLPEAMDKVGMSKFELTDGTKITVSTFYNASIPGERKGEAYEWLENKGHGGIIKTEVNLAYGKGELEEARAFVEWLKAQKPDLEPNLDQSIHWQTLRAFVKEQIEGGKPFPIDMFGVFVGRKAKLTLPKDKARS